MRLRNERSFTGTKVFTALVAVLYVAFMTIDLLNGSQTASEVLKFLSIVICFFMTIYQSVRLRGNKDNLLLNAAFLFTVTADVFLLLLSDHSNLLIYGVISFCIVQMLYLYRIQSLREYVLRVEERVIRKHHFSAFVNWCFQVVFRVVIAAGICLVLYFAQVLVDALLIATAFYITNFVCNLLLLPRLIRKRHYFQGHVPVGLFAIGMLLFFLCDLSVGANNLQSYVTLSKDAETLIKNIAGIAMWGFYLPGQVLIVFSGEKKYEDE